jgi:hypothetical protein
VFRRNGDKNEWQNRKVNAPQEDEYLWNPARKLLEYLKVEADEARRKGARGLL